MCLYSLCTMIKMVKDNNKLVKKKKNNKKDKTNEIQIKHWHGLRAEYWYSKNK